MNLGLMQVSRVIEIVQQNDSPYHANVLSAKLSLPSAVALAAYKRSLGFDQNHVASRVESISNPLLKEVDQFLGIDVPSRKPRKSQFAKHKRELYHIREAQDILSNQFDFFCERFRRSITNGRKGHGFGDLRDAFFEMSDNIVAHAAIDNRDQTRFGLAAYEATPTGGCFTVCDTGCGFIQSLKLNPRWAFLNSHREAISAVVTKQASSRIGEKSGGGFKDLFGALVQLNSTTFLRSGNSLASITTHSGFPQITFHTSHEVPGSQISVVFSTNGPPSERFQ